MIIAIMVLSLGGSIALISFRSSTQELGVSRFTEHEMNSQYLVESGVDQVVSWVMDPSSFPDNYTSGIGSGGVKTFLSDLPISETIPCEGDSQYPGLTISDASFLAHPNGPFSELKVMGEITEIKFYAPAEPVGPPDPPVDGDRRRCTVEVTAISGDGARKRIRVDLARNPIGPITSGIQGVVFSEDALPIWAHWGEIRYTGEAEANLGAAVGRVPTKLPSGGGVSYNGNTYSDIGGNDDPNIAIYVEQEIALDDDGTSFDTLNSVSEQVDVSLNEANPDDEGQVDLRRFLRANGEVYTVSSEDGKLEKYGVVVGTFDELFEVSGQENPNFRLVWIVRDEQSNPAPLLIGGAQYKGYFFIDGDVVVQGGQPGREVLATPPEGDPIPLESINLEGLFYTGGDMEFHDAFAAYGALFSRGGFSGSGAKDLEVWYNSSFDTAVFPGVRALTPLSGTWATLKSDDS